MTVTGATGRANCDVLGSPSARRTKEPAQDRGATGGGGESADPIFFCESPFYISEDTKTGLQAPRANR